MHIVQLCQWRLIIEYCICFVIFSKNVLHLLKSPVFPSNYLSTLQINREQTKVNWNYRLFVGLNLFFKLFPFAFSKILQKTDIGIKNIWTIPSIQIKVNNFFLEYLGNMLWSNWKAWKEGEEVNGIPLKSPESLKNRLLIPVYFVICA